MKENRDFIRNKLLEIVRFSDETIDEKCPVINDQTRILEDLGFTSIAMLYMAVSIEETFAVCLNDVNIWELRTMGDVIDVIERKTH